MPGHRQRRPRPSRPAGWCSPRAAWRLLPPDRKSRPGVIDGRQQDQDAKPVFDAFHPAARLGQTSQPCAGQRPRQGHAQTKDKGQQQSGAVTLGIQTGRRRNLDAELIGIQLMMDRNFHLNRQRPLPAYNAMRSIAGRHRCAKCCGRVRSIAGRSVICSRLSERSGSSVVRSDGHLEMISRHRQAGQAHKHND